MKKIILLLSCVLIMIAAVFGCSDTPTNNPIGQTDSLKIDSLIKKRMNKWAIPGLTFAIAYNSQLIYSKGYGYADTISKSPVTTNSLFRIGSCSKSVTGLTVMKLVQDGVLNLNDTVFGPAGILNQPPYQNILDKRVLGVTIENLLEHTGGWDNDSMGIDPMFIPVAIAKFENVQPPAMQETIIKYVLSEKVLYHTPGTYYSYCNFGYCVLGRVIEKVTGQTYENYVRQNILIPAGSNAMQLGMNLESKRFPNEVTYYGTIGEEQALSVYGTNQLVPYPYGGVNIEAMDAVGQWIASSEDLLNILLSVKNNTIINASTYNIMITPPDIPNTNYAKGWASGQGNIWNQGSLPGTISEIQNLSNGYSWALIVNKRSLNNDIFEDLITIGPDVERYFH